MVALYLLLFVVVHAVPLIVAGFAAFLFYRAGLRRVRGGAWLAGALAVALSCLPAAVDHLALRADLARLDAAAVLPESLALPPQPLLRLQEGNVAGITVKSSDFVAPPFVTRLDEGTISPDFVLQPTAPVLDLARFSPAPDVRLALLSVSGWAVAEALTGDYATHPFGALNVRGAHMLLAVDAAGRIDLSRPIYQRANIQRDMFAWFFWTKRETVDVPTAEAIIADLAARSR